jgi:acyl-CoA synthetase (AMP-forming)/AMP-acid ligase II
MPGTESSYADAWVDQIVDSRLPAHAAAPALMDESGGVVSYGELARRIGDAHGALLAAGLRPGDRIMLVGENCVEMIVLLFAAIRCRAWAVPLNSRLSAGEVDAIREHCQPRLVYYSVSASPEAGQHAQRHHAQACDLPGAAGRVWLGPTSATCVPEIVSEDPAKQVAVMIYTSGTTGAPKGVMLTHRNLMHIAAATAEMGSLRADDRVYLTLPISHSFGLTSVLLCSLCSGAALYPVARFAPDMLAHAIRELRLTVFHGVPAMYARLLDWHQQTGTPLAPNKLRLAYIGGSMIDQGKKAQAETLLGLSLQHGYGLTEAAPTVARTMETLRLHDSSVGLPFPGVEIHVHEPNSIELAGGAVTGGEGELWVRGPNIMKGYYRDPEQTAATVDADGWLHTGDLARIGPQGELYIVGRIKELIIRGGFNVYPAEVEAAINSFPGIVQCAVVGKAVDGDEQVIAYLEAIEGKAVDLDALRAYLRSRLAPYKIPTAIIDTGKLPVSGTGKVLKSVLKKMAEAL